MTSTLNSELTDEIQVALDKLADLPTSSATITAMNALHHCRDAIRGKGRYALAPSPDAPNEPAQALPALPEPDTHCYDEDTQADVWSYSAGLVGEIVRAAIASRAQKDEQNQSGHMPPTRGTDSQLDEGIVGAVARGWCAPECGHQVMDEVLAFAITREVEAEFARRFRVQGGNTNNENPDSSQPGAQPAKDEEFNAKLKQAIMAALDRHETEMEGYSYFGSNPGVKKDDYEDIADEAIAALAASNKGEGK